MNLSDLNEVGVRLDNFLEELVAPMNRSKQRHWAGQWCVFGLVEVEERIWCTPEKRYDRVFAATVGLSARCKSRRLQRVLTDFGIEHAFGASCKRLKEHYGFELGASAVRWSLANLGGSNG